MLTIFFIIVLVVIQFLFSGFIMLILKYYKKDNLKPKFVVSYHLSNLDFKLPTFTQDPVFYILKLDGMNYEELNPKIILHRKEI